MVGEAAAPTSATTDVLGVVVGQQPGRNRCLGNCLATLCRGIYCVPAAALPTIPVPVSAQVLARLQAWQLDLSICQGSSRSK